MRRFGIDPGERRCGVAVCDDDDFFASALVTLERESDGQVAAEIARLAAEHEVREIVVGLPIGMDGRIGPSTRRARSLARAIAEASQRRVVMWDERMSSQAAHRALAASGHKAKDRKGKVDRIAAAILLESYVQAQRTR